MGRARVGGECGATVHAFLPTFEWYPTPNGHKRSAPHTGVLGIKVKIMLPHDPTGKTGPKKPLPDNVQVVEPKKEDQQSIAEPYSEQKLGKPALEQAH